MTLPVTMTAAGAQPTSPATLNSEVIANATALSPGLTANLPGSLIEDLSSTATGALIVCDQAVVDSINNVTPAGANLFVLDNLAAIYGVQQGLTTNTSVYCTFTGSVGYYIPVGFTVSDGSHQYTVQDGGAIGASGVSLYCVATQAGSWAVPPGSVTTVVTSVPGPYTVTVTNPLAGTPQAAPQTTDQFRAHVLQSGISTCQGTPNFIRAQLLNVPGVQGYPNLISIVQATGGFQIIAGGSGDPYNIAGAIYASVPDINALIGSTMTASSITNANPGVVTTSINHGYTSGQQLTITGATPSGFNANFVATVTGDATFSLNASAATFTGSISGSTMTVSGVTGTISIGDYVTGTGVAIGTKISSGSGLTWTLNKSQIVASESMRAWAPFDSTSTGSYTANSGTITPNLHNQVITIIDSPNTYNVPFIVPFQQTVGLSIVWDTTATNVISNIAVTNAALPSLIAYISNIGVGQPINLYELQAVFQAAVASIIPTQLLTRLNFTVTINGTTVTPSPSGTGIISGDPQSYFVTSSTNISISRY